MENTPLASPLQPYDMSERYRWWWHFQMLSAYYCTCTWEQANMLESHTEMPSFIAACIIALIQMGGCVISIQVLKKNWVYLNLRSWLGRKSTLQVYNINMICYCWKNELFITTEQFVLTVLQTCISVNFNVCKVLFF